MALCGLDHYQSYFFMSKISTFLCFVYLITFFQCQQKNQLAQNETALINELAAAEEINVAQQITSGPNKYLDIPEESRSDPGSSPIVLDIISARSDVRDKKLTDLFSKIRYIPIRFNESLDTFLLKHFRFDFLITPNSIIATNEAFGITHFDTNGHFVKQIAKNKYHYTAYPEGNTLMVSPEDRNEFIGSKQSVHALEDHIYYEFHNAPAQVGKMMEYNVSPTALSATTLQPLENSQYIPIGLELFDMDIEEKKGKLQRLAIKDRIPINRENWISRYGVLGSSETGSFIFSTDINGDTLTKFTDNDPVRHFSGSLYRSIDSQGTQYYYNGQQHIRQAHNDTIYIITGSNKLSPKYVLDFGEKGIRSTMEGIDPKMSLADKFIPTQIVESAKYLFMIYTQNNANPNNAKKGTVFYNACIFDKAKDELYHLYIDKPPFVPIGRSWPQNPSGFLENNYDNGPDFWPEKVAHDGMPFMSLKISEIPQNQNLWKGHEAMNDNINKMKKTDYLLMIAQ